MISCSIIQKSQLEGAHRLDAEYYQPEYLEISKKLRSSRFYKKFSNIISGGNYGVLPDSADYVQDNIAGDFIYLIRGIDLRGLSIDENQLVKVPKKYFNLRAKTESGDLLFLVKGATIDSDDSVAIVPKLSNVAIFNGSVFRPRLKEDILPEYVYVFMRTKYFCPQKRRMVSNVGIEYNSQAEIGNYDIFIPEFDFQEEIKKDARATFTLLEHSKSLYSQAENLLLEELGLKNFETKDDLSYVVSLSEIKSVHRADADFFQPKYQKLIELLGENAKPLGKVTKRTARRAGLVPDVQYEYIEISDVNVGNGAISSNLILGKELPANAKIKIVGGELLISKVRPTRGAIAIVPDSWSKNFVASGAFSVFEAPSPTREYLQVVLRSVIGKLQMEKPTTGTSYPTITDQDVENIVIPILPKPTQQKIAELVRQSHESRKKAKELLEEAKRKVEEMIEK